jgi:hypothetical protein
MSGDDGSAMDEDGATKGGVVSKAGDKKNRITDKNDPNYLFTASDDEEAGKNSDGEVGQGQAQEDEEEDEEGRLFVRNLPYSCTEEEVAAFFKRFGDLSEVHLCISKTDKRPTGLAFVLYAFPRDALKAIAAADKTYFQVGQHLLSRSARAARARRPPRARLACTRPRSRRLTLRLVRGEGRGVST